MAEAQDVSKEHGEPLIRLVFGMSKIVLIAKKSVKLFKRHYTSSSLAGRKRAVRCQSSFDPCAPG